MSSAYLAKKGYTFLFLLESRTSITQSHLLHYLCTVADRHAPPSSRVEQPTEDSSLVTQAVELFQTADNVANPEKLKNLLFSDTDSSPSPFHFLQITRRLGSVSKALNFLEWLQQNSPNAENGSASRRLSYVFQAIFELSSREIGSPQKLVEHFNLMKLHGVSLTNTAATLLLRCFGRACMVEESLLVYNELESDRRNSYVRSVVIDVLLKSGRVNEALSMLDEMLKPDAEFGPNKFTGNIFFQSLLRRQKSESIVNMKRIADLVLKLAEIGVFPDTVSFTQLIRNLCRDGKTDKAWDILQAAMKSDGAVETGPCNALLTGLGREREVQKMNFLMAEMKTKGIQPNAVTFGILINSLCKFRRVDEALKVLAEMEGDEDGFSVEPDVVIYNTLIDGLCKVGRQEEGLTLMEQMRSQTHCRPTAVTFNCLIDGFCKAGEIENAHSLFHQMNKEGVQANVVTVNTLVDGMCRHGRINSAMEFFNQMQEKGVKGNAITYSILIDAFCNVNNIEKALILFDEMLKTKCSPDAKVYYTLIFGLSQAGRLDDASSVASKLKEAGFGIDILCYNSLIRGFCKKNKLDKTYEMLKDMERSGVKPDGVTYNTVISYFCKIGEFTVAHEMMKTMTSEGIVPTVVTYGALINGYCSHGNLDEAMKIFRDMCSASRVPPNTVIYNNLIDSLCRNHMVDTAFSLMDDMKSSGIKPNTTTYNAMFRGLQEKNLLEKAFLLMDRMTEDGCSPDYITMEILTEWLSAVGQAQKMKSFLQGYEVSASTG